MTTLSKALTADKINRLISASMLTMIEHQPRTGETASVFSSGSALDFKLVGFTANYQSVIVEVIINKVSVEKIIMKRAGEYFSPQRNVDYAASYLKALRAVPVKNTPVVH